MKTDKFWSCGEKKAPIGTLFPFSFCIKVVSVIVQHKVLATSYAFESQSFISNTVLLLEKVVQTCFLEGRMNVFNQPGRARSKWERQIVALFVFFCVIALNILLYL